jgi:hypothetical protein
MGEGVRRRCMSRPPPTAAQGMSVRTGSGASEARDRAPLEGQWTVQSVRGTYNTEWETDFDVLLYPLLKK